VVLARPVESVAPAVTVVLLIHHPGAHEVETAERIRAQRYGGDVVIHAIDSSRDPEARTNRAIRDVADRWEAIEPASFGHARTRNLGASRAETPLVAFLSQDAHPADDAWLEALVAPLAEGAADASYGRQVPAVPDGERAATFRFLYPEEARITTKDRVAELGLRAFHFSDVTSAFVTDVIRELRFPDELSIFEDVGVAKRLLDAGYRIAYVPEAVVVHAHPRTLRDTVDRYRTIGVVYERLGIFDELRAAGRSLVREGSTAAWRTSDAAPGLRARARAAALAGVKLVSVSYGRLEARWTSRDG